MAKDFDGWNKRKKDIDGGLHCPFYHEREVWWCDIGINIGSEQDGDTESHRRPVVIVRSLGKDICSVVPLTSSPRQHPLRFSLGVVADKNATALLAQIRTVSSRRLVRKIDTIGKDVFDSLKKAIRNMFR